MTVHRPWFTMKRSYQGETKVHPDGYRAAGHRQAALPRVHYIPESINLNGRTYGAPQIGAGTARTGQDMFTAKTAPATGADNPKPA
jgi:hypothetical protein